MRDQLAVAGFRQPIHESLRLERLANEGLVPASKGCPRLDRGFSRIFGAKRPTRGGQVVDVRECGYPKVHHRVPCYVSWSGSAEMCRARTWRLLGQRVDERAHRCENVIGV